MTKLFTKIALAALVIFTTNVSKGQVLFSETFDGIPGPTSGGAGTYVFPSGWLLRNVDNLTPDVSVDYVNEAWERREDFSFNVNDSAAFSTSYYQPAGTADDWMWTPLIGPITASSKLTWDGVAYDPLYSDGYEVRVMTGASGPPTGGTGVIGNQVTSSTVVFTTPAEANSWTSHSVNLSAYAGQSIYIGFRNHSTDMFLLLIDNVVVENVVNYDAALTAYDTVSQYTAIPISQAPALTLGASITNNGSLTITNVRLKVDVLDGTGTSIYSSTSSAVGSLAAGITSHFSVPSYTPTAVDAYTVRYQTLITEADGKTSNDTLRLDYVLLITDSTYARDDGTVTGSLGIGAGNGGVLGEQFNILNADTVTSISVYFNQGYTGRQAALAVWNMASGAPNVIIGGTDTLIYPDDSARFYTIPISGGRLSLAPGTYTFTAIEFDSTLALAQTNNIFTAKTTWVDWPTNPFGGWANNEDFGAGFAKPYVIRPNFGGGTVITQIADDKNKGTVSIYPNPAKNELYLNVQTKSAVNVYIELYDAFGKEVKTLQLGRSNNLSERINVSDLADGLYFVSVHAGDNLIKSKVTILK